MWDLREFRNGELSEAVLTSIVTGFLRHDSISAPMEPLVPHTGWVYLDRSARPAAGPPTWELAEYVTEGGLKALLGDRLGRGRVVGALRATADEVVARAIINQAGTFVAFVSESGEFRGLCDRAVIADRVGRTAAEQAVSA